MGDVLIRDPENSKFGMTKAQILEACKLAQNYGVKKLGLHTMMLSNCLDENLLLNVAKIMFELVVEVKV